MENKFRNEKLMKVGGEEILLRPTFENVATMEGEMGSIGYLAFKFSNGLVEIDAKGKTVGLKRDPKLTPTLTDCAKIIYFNQAETDPSERFNLEEIWDLVQQQGISIIQEIMVFLSLIAAGNKNAPKLTEKQKKN